MSTVSAHHSHQRHLHVADPPPQTKNQPVRSRHGQKTTRLVGVLRAGTILGLGLVFASAAFVLAESFRRGSLADVPGLLWCLIGLGALGACACAYAEIVFGVSHARAEEKDLRARLLRQFFDASAQGRQATPARQISMMTDSVERVTEYRQIYWGATVASVIAPIVLLVYVMVLDWLTGLLIVLVIPLVPATIWGFFKYFRKVSGNSRAAREALTVSYLDAIRQLVPIRLFGAGQRTETSLRVKGEENRRAIMKLLASNQLVIIVMDSVFLLFLICFSVFVISWRAEEGALTVAQALSALLLLPLLLEPLAQVAGFFYIGMGGRASQRVLNRVLSAAGRPAANSTAEGLVPDIGVAISVRNLSHDFGRGAVFKDLSFDISTGSKVAILGESGVGKSTLLSLLRGTLPYQTGSISVNGQNFADLTPEQRARTSAAVSQDTWLFAGTIADNLRLACPDASQEQMWAALKQAHLADDIRSMPKKLATDVGEQGSKISGGQAQRLSLARAFLAERSVILLDEPTSQIDPDSEQKIIEALAHIPKNVTVVMVTHRRSLLRIADTVMTLSKSGLTMQKGISA